MFSSFQLPGCGVALVRNGFCNDETNIAACGYDGGDCCGHNVNVDHCSQCNCFYKETCDAGVTNNYVGDGYCDDGTNIAACNYDGGDCCGSCVLTEYCSNCDCLGGLTSVGITHPLVGNGFCDEETNNIDCAYDGGDCCGPDVSCKWTCLHRIVWDQTKSHLYFIDVTFVLARNTITIRYLQYIYWHNWVVLITK